jgi:hypothetical protein
MAGFNRAEEKCFDEGAGLKDHLHNLDRKESGTGEEGFKD